MSNRVEELEQQVAELRATVDGLTEEVVELKERLRQVEAPDAPPEPAPGSRRTRSGDHASVVEVRSAGERPGDGRERAERDTGGERDDDPEDAADSDGGTPGDDGETDGDGMLVPGTDGGEEPESDAEEAADDSSDGSDIIVA